MAYDDTSVTNLLASIDANTPTVSNTLGALRRFREILYPDLADRNSLFLNIFGTPEFIPRRGLESAVAADLNTVKTQLDAAIAGTASIQSTRAAVVVSGTVLVSAAASSATSGSAVVKRATVIAVAGSTASSGAATVTLATAPAPVEMARIAGAPFTLVKDWQFGASGNITNMAQLEAEFTSHDPFGTIANGLNYGSLTYAISNTDAIGGLDPSLGLPGNNQPVDTTGKYRAFTSNSLLMYVKPRVDGAGIGPANSHNAGDGSIVSKFHYPSGGSHLGKTICWESKFRIVSPPHAGLWTAIWTVGDHWDGGPEMDVIEHFSGTDDSGTTDGMIWHNNSVGGTDHRFDLSESWYRGIEQSQIDQSLWSMTQWHVLTYVYKSDDSFQIWMDGYLMQWGSQTWEVQQGGEIGTVPYMAFLFDIRFGHTAVFPINTVTIAAPVTPWSMEVQYSRIFERTP